MRLVPAEPEPEPEEAIVPKRKVAAKQSSKKQPTLKAGGAAQAEGVFEFKVKPDRFGQRQEGGPGSNFVITNAYKHSVRLWIPETCKAGQLLTLDVAVDASTGRVGVVSQKINGAVWDETNLCTDSEVLAQ